MSEDFLKSTGNVMNIGRDVEKMRWPRILEKVMNDMVRHVNVQDFFYLSFDIESKLKKPFSICITGF